MTNYVVMVDQDDIQISQLGKNLSWVVSRLDEIQVVTGKVPQENHLNFQDEFVILYHTRYHKDTRRLQIGQMKIKWKKVI